LIPQLHTERLCLRGYEPRYFEPYAAMMADPEVTRYLGDGRPVSRADAWRQLAYLIGHWTLRGFGLWAVEERATGELIGRIGCLEPEGWPGFEIAYTLVRHANYTGVIRSDVHVAEFDFASGQLAPAPLRMAARSASTAASTAGTVCRGERCGRRDRSVNPAAPAAW
jgi:hypothetical protein